MSEINSSNFKKEHGDLAPDLVGVTELTSPYFFVPPSGTTGERPDDCEPGTMRFNTDVGSLEIFRGKTIGWEQIQRRESQYLGGGTGSNTGTGTRVLQAGGNSPSLNNNVIQFVTISTFGNAQDFGDLSYNGGNSRGSASSNTRALFANDSHYNTIVFCTFASLGNSTNFGDTTYTGRYKCGLSNQIRGIFAGGNTTPSSPASSINTIDSVTIPQTGNAVDFGNLSVARAYIATCSSSTRGVFAAGYRSSPVSSGSNTVDFITITSTGNATDFGDTIGTQYGCAGASNATRGIISGGHLAPSGNTNTMQFITIATTGNSIDFGDMVQAYAVRVHGGSSSSTRALFMGGYRTSGSPNATNEINSVEIATTGNATDFGDLTNAPMYTAATSNGHGGL
tara:strand:- start:225 stop:1409 length:1185 start_codon:yes stop_codon:yes gene_type:complete